MLQCATVTDVTFSPLFTSAKHSLSMVLRELLRGFCERVCICLSSWSGDIMHVERLGKQSKLGINLVLHLSEKECNYKIQKLFKKECNFRIHHSVWDPLIKKITGRVWL